MPPAGLNAALERSELVRSALATAHRGHSGQTRDSGNGEIPFIEHPVAVAERLSECGSSDEVLAAALLHDAVEHSVLLPGHLREHFGDTVAQLVAALTEDESISSYEERKAEHRRRVSESGPEAQAIFAADKLVNLEVLRDAYAARGEDVDSNLRVSLDTKVHTWEADLEMLRGEAPEAEIVNRLADELEDLRRQRSDRRGSSG